MRSVLFLLFATFATSAICEDVIRSAGELDRLQMSGYPLIRPFDLTGRVVIPCTPLRKSFYLDDGTGIVRLADNDRWPTIFFHEGDRLHVTGQTVLRPNSSINADCLKVDLLERGTLPPPPEVPLSHLTREQDLPLRLIKTRGLVRDVFLDDIDPDCASLVLSEGRNTLYVLCNCNAAVLRILQGLIGAEVAVTGLIRSDDRLAVRPGIQPMRGSRWIMGPSLTISDTNALHLVRPPPVDPFDVPELASLKSTRPNDIAVLGRLRADGIVLTAARPNGFLLQTADNRIVNIDLAQGPSPQSGESVSVVGLPATDLYRINLVRAIWRPIPQKFPVNRADPVRITAEELLTDGCGHTAFKISLHGKRVRIVGIVRSLPAPGGQDNRLTLDCNGHTIKLVADPGLNPFAELDIGDTIVTTGICIMDVEQWRPDMAFPNIKDVSIAVNLPNDIRITSRPSWWTARRLFVLVCILALAALGIAVWNLTLRTLVIRKSRELLREQTHRLTETLRVEERTRLATELHDTVAQNLSGLSLQLDAAGRLADSDPSTMKSILAFSSKALLACRRELRDCLWDLRSQALDERDMNTAIRRALTPHLSNIQLFTRFNVPRRKLADHTAHAVLRILGELANNAVKHGKAKTLRIAGSLDDEGLKFSCVDDGCGFDVKNTPGSAAGHFGLQGIRDRIRAFNGSFQLTSIQGKGTRAVIILHPAPLET